MIRASISRAGRAALAGLVLSLLRPAAAFAHPGHGEYLSVAQAVVLLSGSGVAMLGVGLMFFRGLTAGRWRWVPLTLLGVGLLGGGMGSLAAPLVQGPCRGRPGTDASVEVVRPAEGAVFHDRVPVEVRIVAGRLALGTGLANRPGEGHLHISVDGNIISMIGQERQTIPVPLGRHVIGVEFVANDHISFCPRETVTRTVVVR